MKRSVLLPLGGLVFLSLACTPAASGPSSGVALTTVQVALTDDACTPAVASAPAGPVTFAIRNNGADKVREVELVKGDLIVGEKENLASGRSGSFSVNLPAGEYELYCPGAKTERTKFVLNKSSLAAPAVRPEVRAAFEKAPPAYRSYVQEEVKQLAASTQAFVGAVKAGELAKAKGLYATARVHYERIEPVAESFGDLDPAIDMREDDAEGDMTKFTGFHRLEKALWEAGRLEGMAPVAQELLDNVVKLQGLVNDASFKFEAWQIANGSTELLDEVSLSKITGEEERYSRLDLLDMAANIEGSRKGFELLQPGLKLLDAPLADSISERFATLTTAMAPYRQGDGWVGYDQLSSAEIRKLAEAVNELSEPLSQVAARVAVAGGGDLDRVGK
ncbi:MAG: iron uptake system protein EfeO [Chloroflexi bacterium]|nr:iron uptake system protein EfeO [Chloroflexota bacterium]